MGGQARLKVWGGLLLLFTVLGGFAEAKGAKEGFDPAHVSPLPFAAGERLVYEVLYTGIPAGTAVLAAQEKVIRNGRETYPLLSTAQSNKFFSLFFEVNDRILSYMDAEELYSHAMDVKQREGKRTREKQVEFDQVMHKAVELKNGQQTVFDIPPKVHDSLSSLYYLRTFRSFPEVGDLTVMDVHDSGKNLKLTATVLGKERVVTSLGAFETVKIRAISQASGIFRSKGELVIFLTDDERRIPVMIQSKIKVGSITLKLISMFRP